jgi:hypothetical protein
MLQALWSLRQGSMENGDCLGTMWGAKVEANIVYQRSSRGFAARGHGNAENQERILGQRSRPGLLHARPGRRIMRVTIMLERPH